MIRPRPSVLWLCAVVAAQLLAGGLPAQDAPTPALSNASSADLARLTPVLPLARSPIGLFRELLEMNDAERQRALASYAPQKRTGIEAKIKEYELLSREQRELRLRVTELQYYLRPFLTYPATNRAEQIALLPPEIAPMVAVRLQRWDELSPTQQKALLDNEQALRHLSEFPPIMPVQPAQLLTNMTPAQRMALQEGIDRWQRLPEDEREEIITRFTEFFSLTLQEKKKTLSTLSQPERAQIQKTIGMFNELSSQNRVRIIRGLDRLCRLTPAEFKEFLKNVERWQTLSPTERKAWRDLVASASVEPPLPPGLKRRPEMPPLPSQTGSPELIATNR